MKRLIAGLSVSFALAVPAVVAAATPTWGGAYYSQHTGSNVVTIATSSQSAHGLTESREAGSGPPPIVGKCNRRYQWLIGARGQRLIHITGAGYWSATRVNQEAYPGDFTKVTVTGHFTSGTAGVGTWQVHGCAKHSFTFQIGGSPFSA